MVVAVAVNIVLAAIVFAGLITMIMRAIRSQDSARPAVAARAAQPVRSRQRRAGSLVPARPWA